MFHLRRILRLMLILKNGQEGYLNYECITGKKASHYYPKTVVININNQLLLFQLKPGNRLTGNRKMNN